MMLRHRLRFVICGALAMSMLIAGLVVMQPANAAASSVCGKNYKLVKTYKLKNPESFLKGKDKKPVKYIESRAELYQRTDKKMYCALTVRLGKGVKGVPGYTLIGLDKVSKDKEVKPYDTDSGMEYKLYAGPVYAKTSGCVHVRASVQTKVGGKDGGGIELTQYCPKKPAPDSSDEDKNKDLDDVSTNPTPATGPVPPFTETVDTDVIQAVADAISEFVATPAPSK